MNADSPASLLKRKGFPWRTVTLVLVGIGGIAGLSYYASYRNKYPYGWSHCCSKQLATQLQIYAEENSGRFPSGRTTPEASLGLLYDGTEEFMVGLLSGKTVPEKVTRAALKKGNLGPESTGWHYVEGLTLSDDPQLAIVWDKVGLNHFGEWKKGGGREVIFVSGLTEFIGDWPKFLEKQARLLSARDQQARDSIPCLVATIKLPTGQIIEKYDGPYELASTVKSESSSGHGTASGTNPQLKWYRYDSEGQITLVLTLSSEQLRSKPVTFEVTNGRASPSSIVFEMEKY